MLLRGVGMKAFDAGDHLMPLQQHLYNGLARPADYSIFARYGLARM